MAVSKCWVPAFWFIVRAGCPLALGPIQRRQALALLIAFAAGLGSLSLCAQERVISTDASITAVILALGAGERLVGVDITSELPATHSQLPRVGYHRALSAEGLLSLNPDLVLTSEHAGPDVVLEKIRTLDVAVSTLPAALDLTGLESNVTAIALALKLENAGERLLTQLRTKAHRLEAAQLPQPRTVLLRESDGALRVAGQGTAGDALITLVGGSNLATFDGYRSFSEEALLALNPQILLIAVPRAQTATDASDWLQHFALLKHSAAAQNDRLVFVASEALVGGVSLAALSEADALLARFGAIRLALP